MSDSNSVLQMGHSGAYIFDNSPGITQRRGGGVPKFGTLPSPSFCPEINNLKTCFEQILGRTSNKTRK